MIQIHNKKVSESTNITDFRMGVSEVSNFRLTQLSDCFPVVSDHQTNGIKRLHESEKLHSLRTLRVDFQSIFTVSVSATESLVL